MEVAEIVGTALAGMAEAVVQSTVGERDWRKDSLRDRLLHGSGNLGFKEMERSASTKEKLSDPQEPQVINPVHILLVWDVLAGKDQPEAAALREYVDKLRDDITRQAGAQQKICKSIPSTKSVASNNPVQSYI